MSPQKQLNNFVENFLDYVFSSEPKMQRVESTIIDKYKELNEKCDSIILKIKQRKNKL